jgi:hypothetical protein
LLWNAFNKHGGKNFQFDIWYEGPECLMKRMEQKFIRALCTKAPDGYNLTDGGEGSIGACPSEETRERMRIAHTGRNHRAETRMKMSESAGRHIRTPEHRANLRAMLLVRNAGYKGSGSPRAKPCIAGGVEYGSVIEAAQALGVKYFTLAGQFNRWSKTGRWPSGFGYPSQLT